MDLFEMARKWKPEDNGYCSSVCPACHRSTETRNGMLITVYTCRILERDAPIYCTVLLLREALLAADLFANNREPAHEPDEG